MWAYFTHILQLVDGVWVYFDAGVSLCVCVYHFSDSRHSDVEIILDVHVYRSHSFSPLQFSVKMYAMYHVWFHNTQSDSK